MDKKGRSQTQRLDWPPADGGLDVFQVEGRPAPGESRGLHRRSEPPPPLQRAPQDHRGVERVEGQAVQPSAAPRPGRLRRWITMERLALVALTLAVLAEAAYIGVRQWQRGSGTTPRPPTVQGPVATGTAGRMAAPGALPAATSSGRLVVNTIPAGAAVFVDGRARGPAPVLLADLTAGTHTVAVDHGGRRLQQQVQVTAGREVTLVMPLAAPASTGPRPSSPSAGSRPAAQAAGWITVEAPFEVQVLESDAVVGTSSMSRIRLTPGRHQLAFANNTVNYSTTREVSVTAGKTLPIALDVPKQQVAINATPWAEVWVDGSRIGETPIGFLALSLGSHVVVFRHPDLGERTVRPVVRANENARVTIDMRK